MKPEAPDAKPISFPPCTSGPETFTLVHATEIKPTKDGRKRFWWLGRVITERKWKPWI